MTIIQSILLGLLQGVAEFLPISSSGHLAVAQSLFGLTEVPLLFDVFLHLATLCSVILFFRKTIANLFCVLGRFLIRKSREEDAPSLRLILAILIGTLITGVFGVVLSDAVPSLPLKVIGAFFILTGLLLIFSSRYEPKKTVEPGLLQGVITGFAQGIGVLPGISRSGITISAALLAGIDRKTAGEFSFLLSLPAILGAFLLELKDIGGLMDTVPVAALVVGCVTAFVAGLLSLRFLMTLIQRGKLGWFACYLIPAGILTIIFL
ncbi:MAG: undecaprenyl-diphosphate phosphatase [Spirochaetaceae bacterium]|jgi:undecaprenyl-diphosphatase|nr:undecaprenyl-diphosphate phosphatase [Spirochaetaceae bacterium]